MERIQGLPPLQPRPEKAMNVMPHTKERFATLRKINPQQAAMPEQVI